MDRDPGKAFRKKGPRAERIAATEARGAIEQECEGYVRAKMKPDLLAAARAANAGFKRQTGR